MTESKKARAREREQLILEWSKQFTTEKLTDAYFSPKYNYLMPDLVSEEDGSPFPISDLLSQLEYPTGQLFRIIGPVGVGKTMFREWLNNKVQGSISLKLGQLGVSEQLKEVHVDYDKIEVEKTIYALILRGHIHRFDKKAPILIGNTNATKALAGGATLRFDADGEAILEMSKRQWRDAITAMDEIRERLLRLLGKKALTQLKLELRQITEFPWDTILIDFRDYDESSPSQIRKDIDKTQDFWEQKREYPPNIVVLWQEEITFKGRQFWWGKFEKLRIKPFTSEQLVDFFIELFDDSPDPFTRDALLYVADAARGIFRQFKRYIKRCLMRYKINPITVEHVREWVSAKDSEESISQELIPVFPRSEDNRRKATRILQYLKENGPTSQPDITAEFFGSANSDQVACVRLIKRLETHRHIQRSRVGHRKLISLIEESDKNE